MCDEFMRLFRDAETAQMLALANRCKIVCARWNGKTHLQQAMVEWERYGDWRRVVRRQERMKRAVDIARRRR